MRFIRSLLLVLIGLAVPAVMVASPASATSGAHFFKVSSSVNSDGSMTVSYDKQAGVGNQTVNYTITTDATAVYACINGGGNHRRRPTRRPRAAR